jgi:hypothetical protein
MRFWDTLPIVQDMVLIFRAAALPTIKAIIRSPWLLLAPSELSRLFMASLWVPMSEEIDKNSRPSKIPLITPNAHGIVLEIGPGQRDMCTSI